MGMTIRKAMGLVCVIAAAVPPYVLYAKSEDGNMRNPGLFLAMLAAAVTSFVVASVTKRLPSFRAQLIAGIGGSYLALLGLLFFVAAIQGKVAETLMWTPVILLFGLPFMAPLVGLAWLGSTLIFGLRKE